MTLEFPKFLTKNQITNVTQISDGGTSSAVNRYKLIDRNQDTIYTTIGDTAPATITWTPTAATSINRIYVQGHNWDAFTITYNGGSTFSTPINVSAGHAWTDHYFEFNAVSVTTVEFNITSVQSGTLGTAAQIYCGTEFFEMESTASGVQLYQPTAAQKLTQLSDGTTFKTFIKKNLGFELTLVGVTAAERLRYLNLYNYNRFSQFVFIPEASTTSGEWLGVANHYNWVNSFDIENYTNYNGVDGYDAKIILAQGGGIG